MNALPYELRKWQRIAAIKFAECADKKPNCRAIVQAATGAGKSRCAYAIGFALGKRFMIVVHLDTLASQFYEEIKSLFPGVRVGLVKANKNDCGADIVIASIQTLKDQDRIDELRSSERSYGVFALLVVDEAHHATLESTYARLLSVFHDRPALGLSATPNRSDSKDLALVWTDGIVSRYPIPQAQEDGVLVPITDGRGGPKNKPHRIVVPGIDCLAAAKAAAAGDKEAAKAALGSIAWPVVAKELAFVTLELGRRAAVFTPDVDSARIVADLSKQLGVRCEAVDGKIKKAEVRRRLKSHRSGELQALTSCQILLEGYDDRSLTAILWARQTLSQSVYIQGIGRGLRSSPETDKTDVYVGDLVGAHDAHGLVTGESLFLGESATPEISEEELNAAIGNIDEEEDRQTTLWRSFIACLSGKRLLAGQRKNVAWLPVGRREDCYAYGGADGATYMIESVAPGLWCAIREPRGRCEPAVRLCAPQSLEGAQSAAERAARAGESFDSRAANWREKEANENVRAALAKWRVPLPDVVSAGEASDALVIAIAKAKRRDRGKRGILSGGGEAFE